MECPRLRFGDFLKPNRRPYLLGPSEDANLVGMRLYGGGPFHRELKAAARIQKKQHFVIRAGDVVYNKLFAWKGTFGVVPPALDGMFVSDKFPTYALDVARVDSDYLKWYFRHAELWEQARQMSTGSAALSKLTLNPPKFLALTMPAPALAEQQRIATKIDFLIAKAQEAQSHQHRAAEAARAVVPSALGAIAETLQISGVVGDILVGRPRNGWSARCDNADGGTPVLTLSAVTHFRYKSSAYKLTSLPTTPGAHYWLQVGDLLMSRSNTPDLVGHAAIYDGNPSQCIYPDLMMRLDVASSLVEKRFLWYWLQAPQVRECIRSKARGTSASMKKIAQGTVMSIPFASTTPREEQRRIVAYLDGLQAKVDALKALQAQTAAELGALLPAILDRAFKGEL